MGPQPHLRGMEGWRLNKSTETLPDGSVKVILEENGITAACYVSSHHLVEDKWAYLKEAIDRQAAKAFQP